MQLFKPRAIPRFFVLTINGKQGQRPPASKEYENPSIKVQKKLYKRQSYPLQVD